MKSKFNNNSPNYKYYDYRTSDISDDFVISTETRNWIIRDSDIRSDGYIPNAALLPSSRARAVKIHRFHTRGERTS